MTKVCMTFKNGDEEKISDLLKSLKLNKTPDLVRFLINSKWDELSQKKLMYGGSGRLKTKELLDDAVAELRNMDDQELTAKLLDINYLEAPKLFNDSTGAWIREVIKTLDSGDRVLRTEYYKPDTGEVGEVTGHADGLLLGQVINEVKKQKLL